MQRGRIGKLHLENFIVFRAQAIFGVGHVNAVEARAGHFFSHCSSGIGLEGSYVSPIWGNGVTECESTRSSAFAQCELDDEALDGATEDVVDVVVAVGELSSGAIGGGLVGEIGETGDVLILGGGRFRS